MTRELLGRPVRTVRANTLKEKDVILIGIFPHSITYITSGNNADIYIFTDHCNFAALPTATFRREYRK